LHLVVDLQGLQSRRSENDAAIGLKWLIRALLRDRTIGQVTLVGSSLQHESMERVRNELREYAGTDIVRTMHLPGPVPAAGSGCEPPGDTAELIREAYIESLRPDAILITDLFGTRDDRCVISVKAFNQISTFALVVDWPPWIHAGEPADGLAPWIARWRGRSASLKRCDRAFFLSEDVRSEAVRAGLCELRRSQVFSSMVDAGGDERFWEGAAADIRNALQGVGPAELLAATSPANVTTTGVFTRRKLSILVVKLDHLGDFILSIPSLTKLRAKYPYAVIDIITGSWNAPLARELKLFRQVYSYDFFKRRSENSPTGNEAELGAMLAQLGEYDIAIDLRRQPETRFMLTRISARLRAGYETFDGAIDRMLDIRMRSYRDSQSMATPLNKTPVSRQLLQLVDALPGDPNDFISLPQIGRSRPRIRGCVAIFPKAGTDVREWENGRFIELVRRLRAAQQVTEIRVFFVNDQEAAQYRFSAGEGLSVHVGVPITQLIELLSECHLCIANNSGGVHLASYLGVEVLGIYSGHELAAEWGPQFNGSMVIHRGAYCAPCHLGRRSDCPNGNFCLEDISVEDVLRTAVGILAGGAGRTPDAARRNDDEIVKFLIDRIAGQPVSPGKNDLRDIANTIALNHPAYSLVDNPEVLCVDTVVPHSSGLVQWIGFSPGESQYRWTDGRNAMIRFSLEDDEAPPGSGRILLVADTFGRQRIRARANGLPAFDRVLRGKRRLLVIRVGNLRLGRNTVEFELPDARVPGNGDPRMLAMAVRRFKVVVDRGDRSRILRGADRVREQLLRFRA
jgi:ADP-heptose:LPS heptosyltransferase